MVGFAYVLAESPGGVHEVDFVDGSAHGLVVGPVGGIV